MLSGLQLQWQSHPRARGCRFLCNLVKSGFPAPCATDKLFPWTDFDREKAESSHNSCCLVELWDKLTLKTCKLTKNFNQFENVFTINTQVNMLMHAVPFLKETKSVFSPENKLHGHNGLQV